MARSLRGTIKRRGGKTMLFEKSRGKRIKGLLAVLVAFALIFSLAACSAKTDSTVNRSAPSQASSSGGSTSPYEPKYTDNGDYGYQALMPEEATPAMAESAAPVPTSAPSSTGQPSAVTSSTDQEVAGVTKNEVEAQAGTPDVMAGRKITFWADYSMSTKNYDADYQAINNMIRQCGGYVSSERTMDNTALYDRPQPRYTSITAKIPAVGYESFLDGLSGIGEMTSKNKWSQDLTSEYFDTEARITMLEIRRDRLLNYLLEAEKAEDIIAFERELSSVLNELDSYQSNKRQLDQLVDYATVDITLIELITPETIGKDGEPLGDRASSAFLISVDNVKRFFEDVLVFLAGAAPIIILLVVLALIVWIILIVVRRSRGKIRNSRSGKARQKRRDEAAKRKMEKSLHQQELFQQVQAQRFSRTQYPPPNPAPQPERQPEPEQSEPEQLEPEDPPEPSKPTKGKGDA